MKKLIFILILGISLPLSAQAYEGQGDVKINAGISAFGNGSGLTGTIDLGLLDWLSIGGGVEIYFSNPAKYKDDTSYIFGRANFHLGSLLNMPDEWDLYPGVNLGILGSYGFILNAHVGARYFFSNRIGVFAEIGNHGAIGVSFNL